MRNRAGLFVIFVSFVFFVVNTPAHPADTAVAAAMGAGAAKLAAEGKTEKARDMCYKALAKRWNWNHGRFLGASVMLALPASDQGLDA